MPDFIKILDKPALYLSADTENIKAVVGGIRTDYFAPSVNISFKLQSGAELYFINICDDPDQIQTVDKSEILEGDKLVVRDGDQESTFTSGDASLKIERVFYQKPTAAPRYKLAFSPGVQFFYQPELTAEEIAEGCIRPDNVIGSYAIYSNKQGHYKRKDGSTIVNYGCGKIGHLYAPYWTDADSKKVKGTQEIKDGILTFALPKQAWLDSAKLPIKLDPDVGYTTAGGSALANSNRYAVRRTTGAGESGEVVSMSVAWKNINATLSRAIGLGLYEGTIPGGTPDAGELLSSQEPAGYDSKVDETGEFDEIDFSGESFSVSALTDYWLAEQGYSSSESPTSDSAIYYDTTPAQSLRYSVWSSPWSSIASSSGRTDNQSIYFTYTESGGLPINLTGQLSFAGSLTRQVIYNRLVEGEF